MLLLLLLNLRFGPTVDSNGYNALVSYKIPIVFYYGDYIGGVIMVIFLLLPCGMV